MRTRSLRSAVVLSLLVIPACAAPPLDADADTDPTDAVSSPLVGGAITSARPEIGRWGGCTATLIGSRWILLAAHCWDYLDTVPVPGGPPFAPFQITRNGTTWTDTVAVERTFVVPNTYTSTRPLGADDVMIARLAAPVTGVTPARLAGAPPSSGTVTVVGAGCTDRGAETGAGFKRFRQFTFPGHASSQSLCKGDSGGPLLTGALSANGPVFGVNSGFIGSSDVYGDVPANRSRILSMMAMWDIFGETDISKTGFCTGPEDRLYYGDFDGDGDTDALCHNRATGGRQVALGYNRLIRNPVAMPGAFCSHAGAELHVGDVNGDGRTDLICHDQAGWVMIDHAAASGPRFAGADWGASLNFCRHPGAELHVGDFNGDGRTDLLCHDRNTGMNWFKYATASGTYSTSNSVVTANGWCSHAGSRLMVGDFDADGKTDMVCYTESNGGLHVAHTGTSPTATTTWSSSTIGFCRATGPKKIYVADLSGDGRSDLMCESTDASGAFVNWPSLMALETRAVQFHPVSSRFGWKTQLRPRRVAVASQPWPIQR